MKRILLVLPLLVSSCVQRYHPPELKTPTSEEWKAPIDEETVPPLICPDPEKVLAEASFRPWWVVFEDQRLNDLEYEAIKNSPTVAGAVATLDQTVANYGIAKSALFPEINLDGYASRERISKTQTFAGSSSSSSSGGSSSAVAGKQSKSNSKAPVTAAGIPPIFVLTPPPAPAPATTTTSSAAKPSLYVNNLYLLPTLTYQLDFWGQNWQAMEAAYAQIKAAQEAVQNSLLGLTAQVADTYLQLRTYDAEIEAYERNAEVGRVNVRLNKEQYDAGLINKIPLTTAEQELQSTLTSLEDTRRLRALAEHLLAELIGEPASLFNLEKRKGKELPHLPEIPHGVPSAMLRRRPDVRQQIHLLDAATLNVGVAKTLYFPDFTITLDYGLESSKANKLFKWKSHTWLTAIDMVAPIFTAGRIASQIEQAIAQYKQQVASYISTVLVAFQQVEDGIYSVYEFKKEVRHSHANTAAATESFDLASIRYRMGLENFLFVVIYEQTMLQAEINEIVARRSLYSSTVNLIQSLGGAWDDKIQ